MRIALLEDDSHQAELLNLWLEAAGHTSTVFSAGKMLMKNMSYDSFDLLMMDWNLPDISGDDVLRWVREHVDWRIPVLFVTARDSEEDIVRSLELGADDYMVKPIRRMELLARITALGRRVGRAGAEREVIDVGGLSFDSARRSISRAGAAQLDRHHAYTRRCAMVLMNTDRNMRPLLARGFHHRADKRRTGVAARAR